ncbi:MAG TPA: hypothetical protein VLZ07_07930 [Syntrophales bacterium]|nr:hypothetical protein [Syntrophales bacterium]
MKLETTKLTAREIMLEFAHLTGLLSSKQKPRRYLWTDAFAICNFLTLYQQTNDKRYKELALRLIDQVHNILGKRREEDPWIGWISGLSEEEGQKHPTGGGLRIGKMMNERRRDESYDEQLEWDRDGQYYHYLTKWMHALARTTRVTGNSVYAKWAVELAKAVHSKFTYFPKAGGQKRIYWKMSIDLSYPLVPSMGQHDPIDGLVTYLELQAAGDFRKSKDLDLSGEIKDMADICEGKTWATDDPLGLGELLSIACRLAQLMTDSDHEWQELLNDFLDSSITGLRLFERRSPLKLPADYRLAFRELGLSIGLHASERLQELTKQSPRNVDMTRRVHSQTEDLKRYMPLSNAIEAYWLDEANRKTTGWIGHFDINMVMLATSLAPEGYISV